MIRLYILVSILVACINQLIAALQGHAMTSKMVLKYLEFHRGIEILQVVHRPYTTEATVPDIS